MAVQKTPAKKSPSQNPTDYFKLKQSGGAHGASNYTAPDKLSGGPMREKIDGMKSRA